MVTFTVSGVVKYPDPVLKADALVFDSSSTLVLAPTEKNMTASTTLVIIAGQIDIKDHATITYDLDGRPGFDPITPAPPQTTPAANGFNGGSASGEGSYPQAQNGGNAGPGHTGVKGISGTNGPEIEIFVGKVAQAFPDALTVNVKGQDGGKGGKGGAGGNGGNGQKGAASQTSDSWYDGDKCDREPGRGGNGGRGGDAGLSGLGGAGGNGGIIKVFSLQATLPLVQGWNYIYKGGKGGDAGDPGDPGIGGTGGQQGDQNDPCPSRPEYAGSNGPGGRSVSDMDPTWQADFKGPDGADGDVGFFQIDQMPT